MFSLRNSIGPLTTVLLSIILGCHNSVSAPAQLTTLKVASGLTRPLFACSPPGDRDRLFILEQTTGRILILKNGALLSRPFLDVHSKITSAGNEEGLLGMAFHPDYTANGFFYVNYTDPTRATVVERYRVSSDPDSADAGSGLIIISTPHPFSNHNGGMIAFGPNDGYLYIGIGDGGSEGDPDNNGQNPDVLLSKILRIDVNHGSPYSIPVSNPYYGKTSPRPEIWAAGLRNPWRFSFDRATGDLYIGDVGQNTWEEIDFQPASSRGGENYGWRLMEGDHCYNPSANCDPNHDLTLPIYEYTHIHGQCSVTGGFVYRGCAMPELQGTYFFGDYCSGGIWSFRYENNKIVDFADRTGELSRSNGNNITGITSFGQDGYGELYIICENGNIFKIIPNTHPSNCP